MQELAFVTDSKHFMILSFPYNKESDLQGKVYT